PKVDQMLTRDGRPFIAANAGIDTTGQLSPVIFSPDGNHHAYCARIGEELVIVQDAKELARVKYNPSILSYGPLSYSRQGNHLFYVMWEGPAKQGYTLVVDGKAMPANAVTPEPIASSDGSRWLYAAATVEKPSEQFLMIDGQPAGYFGANARFTGDS